MTKNLPLIISKPRPVFVVLLVVFGLIDWLMLVQPIQILKHQNQARFYSRTVGRVDSTEVITDYQGKGGVYYELSYHYSYRVNDQTFHSSRFRYDDVSPAYLSSADATRAVQYHPSGSEVLVYYNPNDPGDSVLRPGVWARDIVNLFGAASLNFFMLYFLILVGSKAYQAGRPIPLAGGVKLISSTREVRARLPRFQPHSLGLTAAGVLSFLAMVAITPLANIYGLNLTTYGALAIVVLGGAGLYLGQLFRILSGSQDLIIKQRERVVELPITYGRWRRTIVPFSDISSVTAETIVHSSRYGSANYTYAATLIIHQQRSQRLTVLPDAEKVLAFNSWLQEKVGLAPVEP